MNVKAAPTVWATIVGRSDGPGPRPHLMPAQPRLGDGKPVGDGRAGDPQIPDVAAGPRPLGIDQQVLEQARRERARAAERLVQASAESARRAGPSSSREIVPSYRWRA